MQALAFPSAAQCLEFSSLNEASLAWVFFDSGGGTPIPGTQIITPGGKITKPADPARAGYTFGGWYADSGFIEAWDFNRLVSAVELTLYAKWNVITYPIAYYLDGGAQNPANPGAYTIETSDIILADPARAGYTFVGWFADSQFESPPVTVIPCGSIGAVYLYAKWDIVTYHITYALNGGSDPGNPATYNVAESTIILLPSIRLGYTFGGWYAASGFSRERIYQIPAGSTGDIDLYAKFTLDTYIVEYVLNGGDNNPDNVTAYTVYDTVPLYAPDRPGFAFVGWFADAGFSESPVYVVAAGTTGNLKFFARWSTAVSFLTGRERIDRYSGDPKIF